MARVAVLALVALVGACVAAAFESVIAPILFIGACVIVIVLDSIALRRYLGHWPTLLTPGVMSARLRAWDLAAIVRALKRKWPAG